MAAVRDRKGEEGTEEVPAEQASGETAATEATAADLADVKHQLPLFLGRQVGNGETAAVTVVQLKPHVLARPHLQWLSRLQHQLDNICAQRALANDLCLGLQCRGVQ